MSRIAASFAALEQQGRKAFVGYAMAGFPDAAQAEALAQGLLDAGADLLEIGVPFSDPQADGPVIQRCGEKALAAGASLQGALALAAALRRRTTKPLLLMTYYNPPFAMGLRRFCEAAAAAGVDGFIIPDLPPEEAGPLAAEARSRGLDLVLLAAPTSTPARLKRVAALASGFVYFVSVAGITGQNKGFDVQLGQAIAALRKASPLPVAIGFGISTPERALEACGLADGVVSASAVLQPVLEGQGVAAGLAVARALIEATHSAPA